MRGRYKPEQATTCQVTEYRVGGKKFSSKMAWTGMNAITSGAQMTRIASAIKDVSTPNSHDIRMTQVINGKLASSCDAPPRF